MNYDNYKTANPFDESDRLVQMDEAFENEENEYDTREKTEQ